MYDKNFSHKTETKNEKKHLTEILSKWIKWIIYDYLKKNKKDDKAANNFLDKYKAEDYKNLVDTLGLFDKIYQNKDIEASLCWDEDDFNAFLKDNEDPKCFYCKLDGEKLGKFYDIVESDNWTRGRNFEIDRKDGRIKSYLKDKKRQKVFIAKMRDIINNNTSCKSDLFEELKTALGVDIKGECYLYLPAPYNSKNCVFACYWCNNAKTDAFDEEQFKEIGLAIGEVIKKII